MPRLVYCDSCVFIAHLSREATTPVLEGIDEIFEDAEAGKTLILISTITRIEVLECKIPSSKRDLFPKLLRREFVQEFDVDLRIASAAHDIRSFYKAQGHNISVGDSIHVATACLRQADEMFTMDGSGKKRGLIALSGKVADRWHLPISAPRAVAARLFPFTPMVFQKNVETTPETPQLAEGDTPSAPDSSDQKKLSSEKPDPH